MTTQTYLCHSSINFHHLMYSSVNISLYLIDSWSHYNIGYFQYYIQLYNKIWFNNIITSTSVPVAMIWNRFLLSTEKTIREPRASQTYLTAWIINFKQAILYRYQPILKGSVYFSTKSFGIMIWLCGANGKIWQILLI